MKIQIGKIILLILIAFGCTNSSNIKDNESVNFKLLVENWNKAHLNKDVAVFTELYNNSVLFYGIQKNKNECVEIKLTLLKKQPDFYQQIYGEIQISKISESEVKCTFVKRVTVNEKTKDYPSYLTFRKVNGSWQIITEGDLVTDKNLSSQKEIKIPKNATEGDFNGDGINEFAWLVAPKLTEDEMSCIGECNSVIKFSEKSIPNIKIKNCIGGHPVNLGDLNQNGGDEIGLRPDWFTSAWMAYYVWTYNKNKWIYAIEPLSTHIIQWEKGIIPIEIDVEKYGYVIIRYCEMTDEDIDIVTKSVPIKR